MHVGAGMKGGEITVYGDVDSWAGMECLVVSCTLKAMPGTMWAVLTEESGTA